MYYKVVNSRLESAIHSHPKLTVQYKVGEWVYPIIPKTQLMVFSDLSSACNFRDEFGKYVYTCKVKNPKKQGIYLNYKNLYDNEVLEFLNEISIRQTRHKKHSHLWQQSTRSNVVFCSAVKLLELV